MPVANTKGYRQPLTYEQMKEYQENQKSSQMNVVNGRTPYNHLEGNFESERVSALVSAYGSELMSVGTQRIELSDIDSVMKATCAYLVACEETSSFPTNMGLARALGYTQRSLNHWRQKKPDTDTGRWLERFSELCSDVVAQSALNGSANQGFAKFMSQAQYGWRDNLDISFSAPEESKHAYDLEAIRARYLPSETAVPNNATIYSNNDSFIE